MCFLFREKLKKKKKAIVRAERNYFHVVYFGPEKWDDFRRDSANGWVYLDVDFKSGFRWQNSPGFPRWDQGNYLYRVLWEYTGQYTSDYCKLTWIWTYPTSGGCRSLAMSIRISSFRASRKPWPYSLLSGNRKEHNEKWSLSYNTETLWQTSVHRCSFWWVKKKLLTLFPPGHH